MKPYNDKKEQYSQVKVMSINLEQKQKHLCFLCIAVVVLCLNITIYNIISNNFNLY